MRANLGPLLRLLAAALVGAAAGVGGTWPASPEVEPVCPSCPACEPVEAHADAPPVTEAPASPQE